MKYSSRNKPLVCMQTTSTCYKGTYRMKIRGILIHSTGSNNPNLRRYVQPSDNAVDREEMLRILGTNTNRNDWNHAYIEAGLNAWIGKLADNTVAAIQTMPWDYAPWGCASGWRGSCNDGWIQFEICEDGLTDKAYFEAVYKESIELMAYLCVLYDLNPKGTVSYNGGNIPVILCHKDSYNYGMGSNHADIYHWFNRYGKTMDDVRNDIVALMNGNDANNSPTINPTPTGQIYRIRKSWDDAKSQKGAYRNLDAAIVECQKYSGYSVYDEAGNAVFTNSVTPVVPSAPSNVKIPNIFYGVKTKKYGILPDVKNRTDYAGYGNSEIVGVKISVDIGSVKYRVHILGKGWMPYVTGANWNDFNNGWAGDGTNVIDAIEVYYSTDASKTGGKYYRAKYQVKGKGNSNYWPNQYDNEKDTNQDGYAGTFGIPFVELIMNLE